MIIEETFSVNASRLETADFFTDIRRVSACVPGVENVTEVAPNSYEAVLGVRLGPIRAAFQGSLALDDTEAPARLTATGQGRDRSTGSIAKVRFTADLIEVSPELTTVTTVADVALRGRMAHFGTGVIRAAAGEMVKEFAICVNHSLEKHAPAPDEGRQGGRSENAISSAATARPSRGVIGIVLRGVLKSMTLRARKWISHLRLRFTSGRGDES